MNQNSLYLIFILLFVLACDNYTSQDQVDQYVKEFLKERGYDKRTTYLYAIAEENNLEILSTSESIAEDFHLYITTKYDYRPVTNYSITPRRRAIIRNSVSNSRSNPVHSAELSTQYLMGQEVAILKQEGDWFYIQGPDNYLSWMDGGGVLLEDEVSERWKNSEKVMLYTNDLIGKTANNETATDLVFGNILGKIGNNQYITPDGTDLYINDHSVFLASKGEKIATMIQKAKSLMGRPYLWGGTSTKGMDCSGFTRTAFMSADYMLGRDASLQVKEGKAIDVNNRNEWQVGDLLFFGTVRDDGSHKITHVAIHLGDGDIIHSSERVRIESINPSNEKLYNKSRDETVLEVRRIF